VAAGYPFTGNDRANGYAREGYAKAGQPEAVDAPAGWRPSYSAPAGPVRFARATWLEGDFTARAAQCSPAKQEMVASELCTVVDDGTIVDRRIELMTKAFKRSAPTLTEKNGKLCGYMQDKLNAGLMGVATTGNGRNRMHTCRCRA
jgi:TldD protein